MNMQDLIPLKEYAEMHGITTATLRQRISRGAMPEAVKMAGAWFVPRDLPHLDNRAEGRSKRWKKNEE